MLDWSKVKHISEGIESSPSGINWDNVMTITRKKKKEEDTLKKLTLQEERLAPKVPTREELFEKAATPVDRTLVLDRSLPTTDIRRTIAIPEEAARSGMAQFASGIAESIIPRTVMSMQRLSAGEPSKAEQFVQATQPYSNAARIVGRVAGELAGNALLYGTVGKAVSGARALEGIRSPFVRELVGQQLADTLIQTPGVMIEGISQQRPAGEILREVGKQQAYDLAGNIFFAGLEGVFRGISNKIKAGKKLTQQEIETVTNATRQIGGDTTKSIDEQVKILDEYFQSRRATTAQTEIPPIGGRETVTQARIFGETPKGEIPEGMRERGFSRNIRTDTAMPEDIRQIFDEEPLAYKQISNQATLAKAEKIMEQGEEVATAEFYRSIGAKEFKPETVPLAKMLAKQANEAGNVAKAREILSATAERLTEAGQFSQAAKILREADPETFLYTIDKQIRKLNEQGLKQYGKKWQNINLLPDEIKAIQGITPGDQQAYEAVWEQIGNRIAKDLPSTNMEKFDAWRRMAMLLNPKTHIRNTMGNVIMSGMRKVSDTIGAALEKVFVPTGQRTKSFGWSLNKNIASKVDETWDAVKKDILGESRWEIDNLKSLGREKRIFKTPALQWLNEVSLKTLNTEDNIFAKRAFKDALGQFMQANKLTEATDAAIEYAKRRALEATFKQYNELAATLNRWKAKPGVGKLVEAAVPFTKTPANIAMSAIEYSPVGLTRLLFSKGKTPAEIIEILSKGLTGSAVFGLGMWLNSLGWARAGKKRSEKAEALLSEAGEQQFSVLTPQGSYTIDWAQPFAIPFFMGVALSEGMREKDTIDYDAIMDAVARGGDTFFYMSMLQNIRNILGGAGSTTEAILGLPWSYVQQAWPAIFGQTARTVDPVKRSTYDPDALQQFINIIKSRTPGLSQTLEPALSIWGEEQKQGGAIQQFINPGYWKSKSDDAVTNEVARLYSSFRDTDMLPKVAPKSFTDKGIEYRLSPEQVTEFQRKMGQENYNDIARLISTAEYKRMTEEQKVKRIKKIVNDNYEDIKKDIIKASAIKGK